MNRFTHLAFGALVVVSSAGCAAADAGGKAGGDSGPVVLRIGTDDRPARPASDQIEEFARAVDELSNGSIEIQPVWHAAGDGSDWDQRVARMVASGELDLGNIPARAWDTEGVTTLRALNTPFLITNDAQVGAIVSSPIAAELLGGLEAVGVTGLALLPEGLRHPFAYERALLDPDDYAGTTVRSPTSATTSAMFAALGASVTDSASIPASGLVGWESAFVLQPNPSIATANVTFFPKVNSLVVNTDRFDALDDSQREILREAAARTRQWAIDTTDPDHELAAVWCTNGGSVVLADEAQLSALASAVQPVVAQLEADASTASLIADIRQLTADIADPEHPEPCSSAAAEVVDGEDDDVAVLNGVYRVTHTEDELVEAGAPRMDATHHSGTWTLTFENGVATGSDDNPLAGGTCEGSYQVADGRVSLVSGPDCGADSGQVLFDAAWKLDDVGLTLSDIQPAVPILRAVFGRTVWTRIDGAGSSTIPTDPAASTNASALNGIYRFEISEEALVDAGLSSIEVYENTGVWTFTFYDGRGEFTTVAPSPTSDVYDYFDYEVDGDEVVVIYDGGERETYRWAITDDQLTLTLLDGPAGYAALSEVIVAEPWQRIGDSAPIDVKDAPD